MPYQAASARAELANSIGLNTSNMMRFIPDSLAAWGGCCKPNALDTISFALELKGGPLHRGDVRLSALMCAEKLYSRL